MTTRSRVLAAAVTAAFFLCVPTAAHAAVTAAVAGDTGAPVALANGPTPAAAIHNMATSSIVHVDPADGASYSISVKDPAGVEASIFPACWDSQFHGDDSTEVNYHGNGTYAISVVVYAAQDCAGAATQVDSFPYVVAAAVSITAPPGPVLLRQRNSSTPNTITVPFSGAPGGSYQAEYALNGVIAPDGGIPGPVQSTGADTTTGQISLFPTTPGRYVVIARESSGSYYTPWSAPAIVIVQAPFDLAGLTFPDDRGPSYELRGTVGEPSTGGKVSIAYATGKTGKHFHGLGSAKVNSKGNFTRRFKLRKRGFYRLRFKFPGSGATQKGTIYEVIEIKRILS